MHARVEPLPIWCVLATADRPSCVNRYAQSSEVALLMLIAEPAAAQASKSGMFELDAARRGADVALFAWFS